MRINRLISIIALGFVATISQLFPIYASAMSGNDGYVLQAQASKGDASALQQLQEAASIGDSVADFELGLLYANGHGVPQDYAQAVQWYRKAADQGFADAQNNLGVMYGKGHGVGQNNIVSYALYNLSASKNQSGSNHALSNRDKLASLMPEADIETAQTLTQQMITKGVTTAIDNYFMRRLQN